MFTPLQIRGVRLRNRIGVSPMCEYSSVDGYASDWHLLHLGSRAVGGAALVMTEASLENRTRVLGEVVQAVRDTLPASLPLLVRISATDWVEGGWNIDESVALAAQLKPLGVDLIDCSSGGAVPNAVIPAAPRFQVPFAERIRKETSILTAAVGMITAPEQAQSIVQTEQADMVFLALELLRDPYWPLHAAHRLQQDVAWPKQYLRPKPT